MLKSILILIGLIASTKTIAVTDFWIEFNDAPSYPEKQAQVTQGTGKLNFLSGTTSAVDLRDAYCIKITDPNNFSVTSDNNVDVNAFSDFDTRLYLFDKKGKALLFNDDSPPSMPPFNSTLTNTATDGSNFKLTKTDEYVLVIGGFPDAPKDNVGVNLFTDSVISDLVQSANPSAGHFAAWENAPTAATGNYSLALQGVEFCQDNLDIIGTNNSPSGSSLCLNDGTGGFALCDNNSTTDAKSELATGYFNDDPYLDVIFDSNGSPPTLCHGAGLDGLRLCSALNIGTNDTNDVALADINNDGNLDAAFFFSGSTGVAKICLGNGSNGFNGPCSDLNFPSEFYSDIHFAFMNEDKFIDLIIHGFNFVQICSGDGNGDFLNCTQTNVQGGYGSEIAQLNNDGFLDFISYSEDQVSQVCVNNGLGDLTCSPLTSTLMGSTGLALADLNADGNTDVVFANTNTSLYPTIPNRVCLGNGNAQFSCSDVSGVVGDYQSVRIGDMNNDNILDAIFGANSFVRICYGVGDGTFNNCNNDNKVKVKRIELGEFGDFRKWAEINDASSFPDEQAQTTRGKGQLPFILGSTNAMNGDLRDAYCIKITDPANFSVTTDANTDGNAKADFDSRLFLFDKRGKPLLFNDDTQPSASPYASTLTPVSNDGTGFILSQEGEYILVIAGFPDDPMDSIGNNLFTPSIDGVNSANPNASRFDMWNNNNPTTGSYNLVLQGVSYCQDKLDIIATTSSSTATKSNLCTGDGDGGFTQCNTASSSTLKDDLTTGYINHDEHLDVIFDALSTKPNICLGNGQGGFVSCNQLNITTTDTTNVVLGDINNDGNNDIVLASSFNSNHYYCLGNGDGSFQTCSAFPSSNSGSSGGVQLAYMNDDRFLDVIINKFSKIEICPGNGLGGFGACVSTTVNAGNMSFADFDGDNIVDIITSVDANNNNICLNDGLGTLSCTAINTDTNRTFSVTSGDLDGDGDVDAVFANVNSASPGINRVCLNNGSAVFSCNDVSAGSGSYSSVKLGLLNDDNNLDVLFSGSSFTRTCLGDGNGTFSLCSNDFNVKSNNLELGEFGEIPPEIMFVNGFE